MKARVIRNEDLVRVPWKNGGGTTAEVAAFPEGSGFNTFGWRISMADVASDGPFSVFPEIDRTLIVVEGEGIELDVEGIAYPLDKTSPKLSFSGDDITTIKLSGGGSFSQSGRYLGEKLAPGGQDVPIFGRSLSACRGRIPEGSAISSAAPIIHR